MISIRNATGTHGKAAFTLVEMTVVIAIVALLMTMGAALLDGTGAHSRRAAADLLTGMIERARTEAITSRCHVVLAIAEPGDLRGQDAVCRLALFKVERWPEKPGEVVPGVLTSRWRPLESGVALIDDNVGGMKNPLDAPELTISYGANRQRVVTVHAIVFNSRGGLVYPAGSPPVVVRVAEGNYRSGRPVPFRRGNAKTISENLIRIGRVAGRPYRIDG